MKQVSILAPDAGPALRKIYEGLVEPALLDQWAATPSAAPGRTVSSPWPDRIEVARSTQSGAEASVEGVLVEATSTGDGARLPVEIRLRETNGSWLVSSYSANAGSVQERPGTDDAQAAVAVIRDYYDAIASRDFARAYGAWGSSGPRGQSLHAFAAGFDDTKSVRATTGEPSQIGAAAGSRYIDLPVTIVATTAGGDTRRFEGTYTLRRAVVDGASPADRRWHIDHASIRRVD